MEKLCVLLSLVISLANLQISSQSGDNRQPVYVPGQCPENQWYWPGKEETDWVCDCASRFVYYQRTDTCYELYRKGPCQKNEYLVLPKGKIVAECVRNPCVTDTKVPFNGKCHRLYKPDACVEKGGGTLNVNHTSLELECLPTGTAELNIIQVRNTPCPPGSKRSGSGQCRVIAG